MRHLCEPGADNTETFADGVPREGLSRQHVLTRIGVMSLIRKKVQEFEHINGLYSMPEVIEKLLAKQAAEAAAQAAQIGEETNGKGGEEAEATKSGEIGETKEESQDKSTAEGETPSSEDKAEKEIKEEAKAEAEDEGKDVKKEAAMEVEQVKEDKEKEEEGKAEESKDEAPTEKSPNGEKKADEPEKMDVDPETKEVDGKTDIIKKEEKKENEKEESKSGDEKEKEKVKTEEPGKKRKFMFNIADGGFTELHTLWQNEEKAAVPGREYEIWHRRHDYWLLGGVVNHGYGRWQDIQNDPRYAIINEPFKMDMGKGNFLEIKNKFLARRFKVRKNLSNNNNDKKY